MHQLCDMPKLANPWDGLKNWVHGMNSWFLDVLIPLPPWSSKVHPRTNCGPSSGETSKCSRAQKCSLSWTSTPPEPAEPNTFVHFNKGFRAKMLRCSALLGRIWWDQKSIYREVSSYHDCNNFQLLSMIVGQQLWDFVGLQKNCAFKMIHPSGFGALHL